MHTMDKAIVGVTIFLLSAIALFGFVKANDELGDEIPKAMTKCIDIVHFEPEECNLYGLAATEIHGCKYAGDIRLCGQFIPADAQTH